MVHYKGLYKQNILNRSTCGFRPVEYPATLACVHIHMFTHTHTRERERERERETQECMTEGERERKKGRKKKRQVQGEKFGYVCESKRKKGRYRGIQCLCKTEGEGIGGEREGEMKHDSHHFSVWIASIKKKKRREMEQGDKKQTVW